ncbi:AAA family ATPase [Lachnospiraceae bacterium 62-35]
MRKAKKTDYWDRAYKRKYLNSVSGVELNGLNNLQEISFSDGITAICGLNGAGKSTVIAAVKDILGVILTESDRHKLKGSTVNGKVVSEKKEIRCSNCTGYRLCDTGYDLDKIIYLDCDESNNIQEFTIKQANFEELLEQNEEYRLSEEEIEDICYLTGKRYQDCRVWEFEEIEEIGTVPYFQVTIDQIEYDSRSMGRGEHFLLYLFWCINKCNQGTIVIIEEPETYISICSQMHFSNYLGKQMAEKGIQIIMTTHSPYLLEHIKNGNIRIVSRMGNIAMVTKPDDNMMAEDILGVSQNYMGTLFVEDRIAYDFLSIILEDKAPYILKRYTIDIAEGGEKAISCRLEFPASDRIKYDFIGVYDGDMRNRLNTEKLQWKWVFLPGNKPLEELYREYLHNTENIKKFCDSMGKSDSQIITMLATIDGNDHHDWFEELRKFLGVDGRMLVRVFYNIMQDMSEGIDSFISDLKSCINH